jgi:hypothetical protein
MAGDREEVEIGIRGLQRRKVFSPRKNEASPLIAYNLLSWLYQDDMVVAPDCTGNALTKYILHQSVEIF